MICVVVELLGRGAAVVVVGAEDADVVEGATQPVVVFPEPSSQTSVASAGRGVGVTGGLGRSQPVERPPTPRSVWLTVFRRGLTP
jgi:hypothetical protein